MKKQLITALEKIEKLLKNWGLKKDDWMLAGKEALLLQGYNFSPGHNLDIFINRFKLSWKVKEDFQTIPPKDSKELEEYIKCIKKTGIGIHFIPLPQGKISKERIKRSIFYTLPNEKQIRLITPEEEVKIFGYLLLYKCSLKKFDLKFIIKNLTHIKDIKKKAIKKKQRELVNLCSNIISRVSRKYSIPS